MLPRCRVRRRRRGGAGGAARADDGAGRPSKALGRPDRGRRHHRPIIPPSIGFIIFGVAANLSISKLFLAASSRAS
jgi:hypothetical protein